MTTVLHLECALQFGGSVRCLQNFLTYRADPSMRHLVALDPGLAAQGVLARESDGIHLYPHLAGPSATARSPWAFHVVRPLWLFPWIYRLLKTANVSVVRMNNSPVIHLPALLAARAAGVPCVAWLRSFPLSAGRIERQWQRFVAQYVAVSDAVRDAYVAAGVSPERIRTVYDGTVVPAEPAPARNETFTVGTLGRLVRWKGLTDVVQAAAIAAADCPRIKFEIMGNEDRSEPHFRSELHAEIRRLGLQGTVEIRPFTSDPMRFMRSLDCLVNPSFPAEPFGMSIIEAMALARPVVASAGGGPSEIIEDGRSGLLIPPRDPGALAAAVLRLARDRDFCRGLGRAAWRRVRDRFEVRQLVAEQEAVLREAASRSKRRAGRVPAGHGDPPLNDPAPSSREAAAASPSLRER